MGDPEIHFCIIPRDDGEDEDFNPFIPTHKQLLDILYLYVEKGLIKKSSDVVWQEGVVKILERQYTGDYNDDIGLPEEFYKARPGYSFFDDLEGRKYLFNQSMKIISDISKEEQGFFVELELSDDFNEFLKDNGLYDDTVYTTINFAQENGLYKSILLDIIFEDDQDLGDGENSLLETYHPIINDLPYYESLFKKKLTEMGIMEGLRNIIKKDCRVLYYNLN